MFLFKFLLILFCVSDLFFSEYIFYIIDISNSILEFINNNFISYAEGYDPTRPERKRIIYHVYSKKGIIMNMDPQAVENFIKLRNVFFYHFQKTIEVMYLNPLNIPDIKSLTYDTHFPRGEYIWCLSMIGGTTLVVGGTLLVVFFWWIGVGWK